VNNSCINPTRVAEQTHWQALSAILFVERNEFGLNELLGRCGAEEPQAAKAPRPPSYAPPGSEFSTSGRLALCRRNGTA
jgi:hypothetical protein